MGDLWLPDDGRESRAVVVLIHGGFWRAPYTKMLMNGLAKSLTARGLAAWNIEYRRVGPLGGGGGWPETFDDVSTAIDHLGVLKGIDLTRVVTCGHSAGGQLALWAAGRPQRPEGNAGVPERIPVRLAISLAGVLDLQEADRLGLGGDATCKFLGGSWEDRRDVYQSASPAALLPLGVPQVLVHGLDDSVVPPSMSENYQAKAVQRGDVARYLPLEGVGHRDVTDPSGPGWSAAMSELENLID